MPFVKANYPANWPEIRSAIVDRDGHKCKFCGLPNHVWGWRNQDGSFEQCSKGSLRDAGFDRPPFYIACLDGVPRRIIEIVLTVAHLDHDTTNNDHSNLAALCQKCHLTYDAHHHAKNAKRTRDRKAGQMNLEEVTT